MKYLFFMTLTVMGLCELVLLLIEYLGEKGDLK